MKKNAARSTQKKSSQSNKKPLEKISTDDSQKLQHLILEQHDKLHILLSRSHALVHVASVAALEELQDGIVFNYFDELARIIDKALALHLKLQNKTHDSLVCKF